MEAYKLLTSHKKFHINLGLERIKKILTLLDNPQEKYKTIHIAGTNGKGSTSKIINEILVEHFKKSNKKIGLYTSPHLFSYEERIKINNQNISCDTFQKLTDEIDTLAQKNKIELSEFELLTAVGFYYFSLEKVEYAIVEVGLGGAFDATNVITPEVGVITTIDFDHSERLGKTLDEIAQQKAGIIKQNSKIIVSNQNKSLKIIENIAKDKSSKLIQTKAFPTEFINNQNFALIENQKIKFNLLGSHQGENLALALRAIECLNLDINNKTIQTALKNVSWRFRLEYHKEKNVLIDGAHNPSGISVLRNFLDENFNNTKKTFVFGCLKNKDYENMLDILIKNEDEFYFWEFNYPNSLKFEEIPSKFNAKKINNISEIKNIINENKNLKIFCGSLYMLGTTFKEINM